MLKIEKALRMDRDARQEQILEVAAAHFARNGYDKAAMAGIAREAGVTRALVYHYFPSKAALLEAVLHSKSDTLLAATSFDPGVSPMDNIRAAIHAYLDHFSPTQDRAINLHLQAASQPVMVGDIARANHTTLTRRMAALLALPDDRLIQSALSAWLDFVTTLSAGIGDDPNIDRESAVDLCIKTLQAVTAAGLTRGKATALPLNHDKEDL